MCHICFSVINQTKIDALINFSNSKRYAANHVVNHRPGFYANHHLISLEKFQSLRNFREQIFAESDVFQGGYIQFVQLTSGNFISK